MTDNKPAKKVTPPDLAVGIKRAPGGWRAYEARLVEGRCTSTRWLCETCTYGEALMYMRKWTMRDWTAYYD